jgi:hypothetical protein
MAASTWGSTLEVDFASCSLAMPSFTAACASVRHCASGIRAEMEVKRGAS